MVRIVSFKPSPEFRVALIALLVVLCISASTISNGSQVTASQRAASAPPVRQQDDRDGGAPVNVTPKSHGHEHPAPVTSGSLADNRITWPSWAQVVRVLLLRDYNTRVVLLGSTLLGITAGIVGVFMLLRRRSLVGDVVSHASLPGIAIAFLVMERMSPGSGKSLGGLLIGAFIAGMAGMVCSLIIRRTTRIKEDAALAIVLSIFFGVGIALFTVIQSIPTGNAAGLNHFIFGKASSMIAADVKIIAWAAGITLLICTLLFKEFAALCFDDRYAATQGFPVVVLDLGLMILVASVTVIGLQSVGLLLVVALLIIPAAAARFWTDHLFRLTVTAAVIGGLSAYFGVVTSALFPRLAAGAVIVLVGAGFFVASLLFGTRRGIVLRMLAHQRLKRNMGRHHLLRAFYEAIEPNITEAASGGETAPDARVLTEHSVSFNTLLARRSWNARRLRKLLGSATSEGIVYPHSAGGYRLTGKGALLSRRVAKNHRLWELYLIHYADIAPSHVDRDADQIEHILSPELLDDLERLLEKRYPHMAIPKSPHEIPPPDEPPPNEPRPS